MKDEYKTKKQLIGELIALRESLRQSQCVTREVEENRKRIADSEKYYRDIVDNANSIILRMDVKGNVTFFNDYAQNYFGYSAKEIIGRNVVDTIVPERKLLQRDLSSLLVDFEKFPERYVYNEFENVRKNGERVWVAWTNKALHGEDGSIAEIISIGNDITKRRLAEKALRTSEANYRSIFNSANDTIFVHESKTGKIIDVNRKFAEMFKFDVEDALNLFIGKICLNEPPYSEVEGLQWIRKAVREGPQLFEWLAKKRDGELFWVEVNLKRATINERDCVLAITRDISKRKQAEKEIREKELQYSAIFNSATDAFIISDFTGNILDANPQACEMHGYAYDELVKLRVEDIVHSDSYHVLDSFMKDVEKKGYLEAETLELKKDGTRFNVELRGTVFDYKGNKHLLTIKRDVTERKQVEKALQESEKKYKTLYESSQDAIMLLNETEGFISGNPATVRMFGCEEESEFKDRTSYFFSPEYQPDGRLSSEKAREMMSVAMKKGSHFFEWLHNRLDGTEFYSTVLLTRMELDGKKLLQATVRDITERKEAEKEREEYVALLRILSSKLLSAQEDEKKRVVRELHDGISQALTAIKFRVENALQQRTKHSILDSLGKIVPMLQEAVEDLRRVTMDLRPSILDDLGIVATISWYCRQFETIYPTIRIQKEVTAEEARIPEPLKITIYRIMQEGLTNIVKHTKADLVRISLEDKNDVLTLAIRDNGQGFNLDKSLANEIKQRGFGITSMKERTELSGGLFHVNSVRRAGTVIHSSWPIRPSQE
ncbi:MAG: PAS domain S-box protein [Deltaproteobacteria bacterium]|nr:PAS domain S-box protein [Deltaproteobacteria bacterium]